MNTYQDFEFFIATIDDKDEIFALWRQVFQSWSDDTALIIKDRLNSGFLSDTVIIPAVRKKDNNKIIAAARLELFSFADAKKHEVKFGIHVGEVAVLQDFQGTGLGTFLMENTVEILKNNPWNATFAFLGGYTKFYSRFGFEPILNNTQIEIKLTPERGGTKRFSVIDRIEKNNNFTYRKLDVNQDFNDFYLLQPWIENQRIFTENIFNREFTFRKDCFELDCNVYPVTGKLESYLFYYGNCIYSFSIKQETVTDMFLRETIHKMYNNGFETIVVTCNIDFMEKYLQENCIPYRKITSHGALCSQMRLDLTKNLIKSIH